MATEILEIPEEYLREVITVIRTGLMHVSNISKETIEELTEWCNDEEEYLDDVS